MEFINIDNPEDRTSYVISEQEAEVLSYSKFTSLYGPLESKPGYIGSNGKINTYPVYVNSERILFPIPLDGCYVKYANLSREALTPIVEEIVKGLLKHDIGEKSNA